MGGLQRKSTGNIGGFVLENEPTGRVFMGSDLCVLMPKTTASGAARPTIRRTAGWISQVALWRLMAGQGYGLVVCGGNNRPTRFFGSRTMGCIKDCMIPETVSRDTHIPPQGCQRSLTSLFTSATRPSADEAVAILYSITLISRCYQNPRRLTSFVQRQRSLSVMMTIAQALCGKER